MGKPADEDVMQNDGTLPQSVVLGIAVLNRKRYGWCMPSDDRISDLLPSFDRDAFVRALQTAYSRGFEDAQTAMRAQAVQAIQGLSLPPNLPADSRWSIQFEREDLEATRAPRGLTRRVMTEILRERGALKASDLQRLAAARDGRISEKTVYNELMREKGVRYREERGLWNLTGENPVAAANTIFDDVEEAI